MKFFDVEQGSLEWRRMRLGIPTSSEFDKLITNKTRKVSSQARDYRDRLLSERISGEPWDLLLQNRAMEHGQELQDDAVNAYEFETGLTTERGGFFTNDEETAGASPDRLVGSDGLVEIKCPLLHTQVHAALSKEEAEGHMSQIQGQLLITGRQWVDLFHFHPLLALPPRRVWRDEEFLGLLSAVLEAFLLDLRLTWADLEREYGPFPKRGLLAPPPVPDPEGISEEDVDAIFAARRRELSQAGPEGAR
jgi:hypothetical protein